MRALALYGGLLLSALMLPIVVVVIGSLTAGERLAFPPDGLSLRWYAALLGSREFVEAAWTSLEVAALTSLAAGIGGGLAALALARRRLRFMATAEMLLTLPLGMPSIALGLAFLICYTELGFGGSKAALVCGHTIITLPFALRLVRANFAGYGWNLERAAANLGGRPWQVFWHVTLPLMRPGVIGGMIFAFIMSFDEVVIALFLSGPDAVTLPVRIFTYLDQSPSPIVLAAGSVLVLFAVTLMLALEWTVRIGRAFGLDET
jgi:putative spermidine/putrescine transport system permease protein